MTTNAVKAQGTFLEIDNGAGGWLTIGEMTNFDGPGGSADIIDVTHLQSTAREKLPGLPDEGQFSFDLNLVPDDAGQVEFREAREANEDEPRNFRLHLPDAGTTVIAFDGFALNFAINGGVNGKIAASALVEITGPTAWS